MVRRRKGRAASGARVALAVAGVLSLALAACLGGPVRELTAQESAALDGGKGCVACHVDEALAVRASRAHRGTPERASCALCHGEHSEAAGAGAVETVGCAVACHASVRAAFDLPFSHPLGVAASCTDCHDPHGGNPRRERSELRFERCVACHQDLRGPFVFEHDGNRVQRCLSCHVPHGSANRRMLTQARTSFLCTKCHTGIELIHQQLPGSAFLECLNCHVEVHGSNWDLFFFR